MKMSSRIGHPTVLLLQIALQGRSERPHRNGFLYEAGL